MNLGRPSATLVMGVMAGTFAALSFLPTSIPLIWQIIQSEERSGLRHATATAFSVQSAVRRGVINEGELFGDSGVQHLTIRYPEGHDSSLGRQLSPRLIEAACASEDDALVVQERPRVLWAVACIQRDDIRVVAGIQLDPQAPAQRVIGLVLLLASFVGLVTALGVQRLMRPLSEVSRALARVGAGERGVRMPQSGFAELDELVDRLNAAARSVDDREDAILGRIEVVQEMARIVAHEVRNPLQSLELLTSLIACETDDTERLEIAQSIHNEIRTLEQVVTRLLRESALRGSLRLRITRQPIAPLVEQVLSLRRPQANGQGVRLSSGALSWSEIPFDQALVKRSIENLVLNALQVVPRGTGEVRVTVMDEPEWMLIAVDDNGPGVSPELQDHIFEPNVSGRKGGTGLGLALVKGVVEAHNGYIEYGRSPLGGARFEARIPLTQVEESIDADEQ